MITPIPPEAMPVVEVLRRDVKRPEELPKIVTFKGTCLRWGELHKCPMGLHPSSCLSAPYDAESFADGELLDLFVQAFADWWDSQTDAQAAVDAVWPKGE